MSAIRILKHEGVPNCGSFEVRYADGRPSQFLYFDDLPSRRLRPETSDRKTALEQAKATARAADMLALVAELSASDNPEVGVH
jgi:hypothetical protein